MQSERTTFEALNSALRFAASRSAITSAEELAIMAAWNARTSDAVIRDYGDKRYQQAIADVVEWLRAQQHGRTSDNYPGYYARQIEQRFGKDA